MALTTYDYDLDAVDQAQLTQEILASGITNVATELYLVENTEEASPGLNIHVTFLNALSAPDIVLLNAVIAAHPQAVTPEEGDSVVLGPGGTVDPALLPSATETDQGVAEIATQGETDTGTDDARFVTPLKLKTTSLSGRDTDAIHKSASSEISSLAAKATPVVTDVLVIEDSAAGFSKKKVAISNLPAGMPAAHASTHVSGGVDKIRDATATLDGLATAAQITKLDGIAVGANNYSHPNHSGDVTSVGDGAQTIAANAVDNAKLADMASATIKGRVTAAVGDPEDLTAGQARTVIDVYSKSEVDGMVTGLYTHKGSYDASTNTPDLDTAPSGVKKGDAYTVSVAGNFFTEAVEVGDVLIADQDDPTVLSDWTRVNKNISFGTTAGTACEGNDARLSDARTPTAHAASHVTGGADKIRDATAAQDGLATAAQITKLDGIAPGADVTPSATEILQGKIEIATQAETDAGSDDTRAITPAKLANYSGLAPVATVVTGVSTITRTLATYAVIPGMTLTPGAGTYLVTFGTSARSDKNNRFGLFALYANGAVVPDSEREAGGASRARVGVLCQAKVTLGAGQAIDARWKLNSTGNSPTLTIKERTLTILKVA